MATLDTIRRLTVQGQSVGLDKLAADLKAVSTGQTQVAETSAKLVSATTTSERSTLSAAAALDRQTKALDPLAKALAQQERLQRAVGTAQAQGVTLSAANERAMANAAARVRELQEATEKHTASVGLNRMQMMEGVHVLKSFADQVIAGQSPMRALAVEGGRIGQILTSGQGGMLGGLKSVGAELGKLANPIALMGGALAGLGIAGAASALAWEESQTKLAASLEGTGRAAGSTVAQLNAVAEAGAKAGRISNSEGRELAGGFAHAGISADQSQTLIGSTPAYARASGQSVADAGKALAQAFADPEKGAETLNQQLGFLNDRVATQIHNLEASGNLEGARRVEMDAYLASLRDVTDHTWTLSRAFDGMKVSASNAFDRLGRDIAGMFGHRDPSDDLRSLTTQRDLLPARDTFNRDRLQVAIDALTKTMGQQNAEDTAQAAAQKRAADANTQSMQAREVIRSILPEIQRNETYTSQVSMLQRVIGNSGGMTGGSADATRALGQLSVQHVFSDPFKVMQQDAQLALAAVNATSLAERAAVDARRAELAVLRETGDVAKASAAAQDSLNVAMAKARSDAEERLVTSQQNLAMVGMTPFQRAMQEVENRYKGAGGIFEKDSATGSQLTTAMAPIRTDLQTAGDILADTLREIAEKAKAAFLTVDGKPLPSPFGTLGGVKIGDAASAIKAVESGGNYGALGPLTKGGDRAFGAYQVMGANVPAWSRAALGYSLTPSQFLADPSAQDAVFNHQFGQSMSKYGNASDAASVWFTGRPMAQGAGAKDVLGTTGAGYVGKFNAALTGGASALTIKPNMVDAAATMTADRGSYAADKAAVLQGQQEGPIKAANTALDGQVALLKAQQDALGGTDQHLQAVIASQTILNQYMAQGTPVTSAMSKAIQEYGERSAATDKALADLHAQQQKTITSLDTIRSTGNSALSGLLTGLRSGQTAGQALNNVLTGIEDKLLNAASSSVIDGLFGKSGTANGGLLGGSSSTDASAGGFFSSVLGSLVKGFVHHDGGMVGAGDAPTRLVHPAMFAAAPRYHTGMGLSHDERPAILQTGEAVISRADLAAARAQKSQGQAAPGAPAGPGTAGGAAPSVTVHNYGGQQVEVTHKQGPDMQKMIEIHVGKALQQQAQSNGPGYQAFAKRMGTGRVG